MPRPTLIQATAHARFHKRRRIAAPERAPAPWPPTGSRWPERHPGLGETA